MTAVALPVTVARQRNVILALLIALAAVAWALLAWQWAMMDEDDMGLRMGMSAPIFIVLWVVMMIAMMFPTAAPMVLTFARVQANKRERSGNYVQTWVFVMAYLALWSMAGVGAFAIALGLERWAENWMWLMDNAGRIGGLVLIAAAAYQFSPLKRICLSKCRTPMNFIVTSWREGRTGAIRMGLHHGAICMGCCWLLFVILFPLGVMNIGAMALVTLVIFAEKTLPRGILIGQAGAVALGLYGLLVVVMPDLLPTMM